MAKKYDIALNTNKKLSELIDQDLQKESQLLQNLINEVVEANQKVKSSHQKRVDETKRRLRQLNDDIELLKNDINKKEKDTTLEQLNYLLDSKNRIYKALQEMRQKNIDVYLHKDSTTNTQPLKDALYGIIENHIQTHTKINPLMERFRENVLDFVEENVTTFENTFNTSSDNVQKLSDLVNDFTKNTLNSGQFFKSLIDDLSKLEASRMHILQSDESEDALSERIEKTYEQRRNEYEDKLAALEKEFETEKERLIKQKENIYATTLEHLKEKHKTKLDNERETRENLQKDLKTLRLEILQADKENNEEKLKSLLKAYDTKEKSNLSLYEEKVERMAQRKVKSEVKKINKKLYFLEKNYLNDYYAIRLEQEKLRIEKSDSKELFKLREDFKGLSEDLNFNQSFETLFKDVLKNYNNFIDDVVTFKKSLNELYIERENNFLTLQNETLERLGKLEESFKAMQMDLVKHYRLKLFDDQKMREKVKHEIHKHNHEIQAHQQHAKIDKRILDQQNHQFIRNLSDEEEIQSEKIYQNALIELANKEYELQLLKIRSLYDNEIDLTKSQADRLNIGYDVNEAMVSTTLESQILFAKQQIEYAKSEYELRLENIEQSLDKEKEYAEEKLEEHQQKYKTDRIDIIKERDRKLEDLSYKQALFTEEKEKKQLDEQEEKIKEDYAARLLKVDNAENNDPYVTRYKKQLDNAYDRANKAKQDAKNIRDKSIATFETMLKNSEEKLEQFKNSKQDSSLTPMIESEESTAKSRLDQSIEDAKTLYEEKVNAPKERLKELDEALRKIHSNEKSQAEIEALEEERNSIDETLTQQQEQINNNLNQALQEINDAQQAFLDEHQRTLEAIQKAITPSPDMHTQDIKTHINTLKKEFEKEITAFKTEHTEDINTFKQSLSQAIKNLNQAIMPAYKGYQSYLKDVTSNTQKREKKVKDSLNSELKSELRNLQNMYK